MGDQDHDSFFSSVMLKHIDNKIPIEFNQATPSKTTTRTTKSPSSITEEESYEGKKCDQLAINHLMQELCHEIKDYILCLQQDNKTDYMNEYIKAMQDQIASLKSEVMFLRGEVKKKNAFIEQLNNNDNDNDNNNNNNDDDDYDNNIPHKTSNSSPNISNNDNSSNVLNDVDNDNDDDDDDDDDNNNNNSNSNNNNNDNNNNNGNNKN